MGNTRDKKIIKNRQDINNIANNINKAIVERDIRHTHFENNKERRN